MTTWIKRQNVWVGCKMMKLLQETQLLARVFVIQYSFNLDLGMLIEANEMSTILFSLFCNDCYSSHPASLLLLNLRYSKSFQKDLMDLKSSLCKLLQTMRLSCLVFPNQFCLSSQLLKPI